MSNVKTDDKQVEPVDVEGRPATNPYDSMWHGEADSLNLKPQPAVVDAPLPEGAYKPYELYCPHTKVNKQSVQRASDCGVVMQWPDISDTLSR